ncbi:N-acetylglucosamine-6-phosphate deacetylase [Boudabousia liubingyangii]|uniref:N-acetylglucosamine-6-phosphate deacetylase n=1 Tax=Boudabousia liubingyangii TaxID=1921764 RepID=A0A1Q5PKS0_9ACTO|nr:N-acetylglucosamine-6-phosphate deacetylase [Boudabousia liubingyangii]OKL47238.1 N-acetylglucosamine-6-phosphate deacetylase [Boudabousia liubingyangii]
MSNKVVLRGAVVTADTVLEDGVLVFEDEKISYVGSSESAPADLPEGEVIEGYILPGLVDVHCHGGGGASFPDSTTAEELQTAIMEHRRHGTTSLVGSCVTADPETLKARAALMADQCEAGELAGIHFEGPFVSKDRCGAQDPRFIIDPDAELTKELIAAGRGHVKTMTIAPEKPNITGPDGVSAALINNGALPSFGHTDSDPAPVRAALEDAREHLAKAEKPLSPRATVTHLFNGMRPLHHRNPGPIAECLSDAKRGGVVLEMIADGIHLHPSIVRDVYETVGRENIVFVTDAMAAAGMPDGSYVLGPQAVTVKDGIARLTGGDAIAGGTSHLLDQVRLLVDFGMPLVDVVYCASEQGAKILGDTSIGALAAGKRADAVCVDVNFKPLAVYRKGQIVE